MPWRETCVMDLKMHLISDWLQGRYTKAELARAYHVSRKTVYKWTERYTQEGAAGLLERSRAPGHCPHALDPALAEQIVAMKLRHPSFGPKKVLDRLRAEQPAVDWPADSTAGALLKRQGLVKPRRYKPAFPADPQPFALGDQPNALWSVDYKGQYPSNQSHWCYPLTITDNASRYLIGCRSVSGTDYAQARSVFEWAFQAHGVPEAILSDNGPPFASCGAGGLTRLSLWWIRHGIRVHRTEPGKPTQNARHERMHASLNYAIGSRMKGASALTQQQLLAEFRQEYNTLRSHESLERRPPASLYTPSPRLYTPCLKPLDYDTDQLVRSVRHNGEIKFKGGFVYISELLAKHPVGLRQIDEQYYEVRFSFHLLGHLNMATQRLEKPKLWHGAKPNKVSPMLPV